VLGPCLRLGLGRRDMERGKARCLEKAKESSFEKSIEVTKLRFRYQSPTFSILVVFFKRRLHDLKDLRTHRLIVRQCEHYI
jgi:hypothetical protein